MRNILFLIADDWSPIAGCYGYDFIQTPNIDRLAARGTAFDRAFCTSPSCAVSRACILTGLHSHEHGQYGHCHGINGFRTHTHQGIQSLPALLREAGYWTGLIGKNHTAPQSVYPFESEQGFGNRGVAGMAERARTFIEASGDRPFYLHMGFSEPHRMGRGFGNEREYEGVTPVVYDPADVYVPPFLPDTPAVRGELADYYQALSRFDSGIGMALDVLEQTGHMDDTLVVITADHGIPFTGAKASNFDTGHNCPSIISMPGQARVGHHNDALFNWLDYLPTLCDWAGVTPPERCKGRSLLPILAEEHPTGWDETYLSHNFHEVTNYYPYRILRERRWKFVRNLAPELPVPIPTDLFRSVTWTEVREKGLTMMGQRPTQRYLYHDREALFDMDADPLELTNLVNDPQHAERAATMRQKLYDFRTRTRDTWLELDFQRGDYRFPTSDEFA